jgi:hypothetical protein
MSDDFPTFDLPANAISAGDDGRSSTRVADMTNRRSNGGVVTRRHYDAMKKGRRVANDAAVAVRCRASRVTVMPDRWRDPSRSTVKGEFGWR